MMTLVGGYAPRQEVYSIDECFLGFDGVPGDLTAIGRPLRAQVLQWIGLPTSVGIGPTKTLAKLANHVAKVADRKPGSYGPRFAQVCHLGDVWPADLQAIFQATDVGAVWGVGRRMTARLHEGGIRSVNDLVHADVATQRRRFSVALEKTVRELRGTVCMDVDHAPAPQQQMVCPRSVGVAVTDLTALAEVVSQFATRVAEKARLQRRQGQRHIGGSAAAEPAPRRTGSVRRQRAGRWCTWPGVTPPDGSRRCAQPALRQRRRDGRQCPAPAAACSACRQATAAVSPVHHAAGRDPHRARMTPPRTRLP